VFEDVLGLRKVPFVLEDIARCTPGELYIPPQPGAGWTLVKHPDPA
jgi:hypothetical protein